MRAMTRSLATVSGAAVLLVTAACDRAPAGEPVTFAITADSLIEMRRDTLVTGDVSTECAVTLRTSVAGPEGEYAVVRGGRVDYTWMQTGDAASSYEWNAESAHRFWGDTIVPVGDSRLSREHGFGLSSPDRPIRGSVTFRYVPSNGEEERVTEPFRFYCY